MNKDQTVEYMVEQVEIIERGYLSSKLFTDPSKGKKEAVGQILKVLEKVQIDDEN